MIASHQPIAPAQFLAHNPTAWAVLSDAERIALASSGRFWLRAEQAAPANYRYITYVAGRGFGKTDALAYEVNRAVDEGRARVVGLAATDEKRTTDVQVNALIKTAPPWNRCELFREALHWENGAVGLLFSPEAPTKPRGANLDHAWLTEVAHWPRTSGLKTFHNITTACRVSPARVLIDTTSHGRSEILDHLFKLHALDPTQYPLIRGETYQNPILTQAYLREQYTQYAGRTLREELNGEYISEVDGALWDRAWIDGHRVDTAPPLELILVGCDPAESTRADSDDTGLIVAGRARDGHVYLLRDRSGKHTPETFAGSIITEWRSGAAGAVLETNRGGHYIEGTLRAYAQLQDVQVETLNADQPWPRRSPHKIYVKLVHSRGAKASRADGTAALAKNGRLHHVGAFGELEHTLLTYDGDPSRPSPDTLDALVLAVNELADINTDRVGARSRSADIAATAEASRTMGRRITAAARSRSVL